MTKDLSSMFPFALFLVCLTLPSHERLIFHRNVILKQRLEKIQCFEVICSTDKGEQGFLIETTELTILRETFHYYYFFLIKRHFHIAKRKKFKFSLSHLKRFLIISKIAKHVSLFDKLHEVKLDPFTK